MSKSLQRDPRPWHVLLSPIVPILALLSANLSDVTIRAAAWPVAIALCVVVLSWIVLATAAGNAHTSALVITILTIAVLSRATVTAAASLVHLDQAVPLLYVLAAGVCAVILRAPGKVGGITNFANVLLSMMALLLAGPMVWKEIQRPRAQPPISLPSFVAHSSPAQQRPDVYVLILDGYGRADVLRDYFGVHNRLIDDLQRLGFFVAHEAASNYAQTTQSLASSLNLEYLSPLLGDTPPQAQNRRTLADLITDNRTFEAFRAAGYRITAYESEYGLIRPRADEHPRPLFHLTDFAFGLYEGTAFPPALSTLGLPPSWLPLRAHRRNVLWTLNHLAHDHDGTPRLVFAHLLMPHPPFVFNADGGYRSTRLGAVTWDGDYWEGMAKGTGESYIAGYVDAVTYLNGRILEIVRTVLNRPGRPAIIYIQSDHGPGSQLHWDDPSATDMRERFGIMLAVRFPDGDYSSLHARVTPVNASRALLNHALGTDLPPVDDRSYFSRWNEPFEWLDVTGQLAGVP